VTEDTGQAGRLRLAWRAFRRWRHTRPFLGGLLVTLGGAEILASERAPLPLVIHIGLQGLAGYLVPVVLVLCGLLLLFHPVQQTFYSILAILLALGSWVTSNLGGFFVGMLLGLVGGCLAFAWQRGQRGPAKPRRVRPGPRHERSAGLALIRGEPADGAGEHPDASGAGGAAMLVLPPVALALSVLAAPVPGRAVPAPPPPATSASPSVTPSPLASPTASPTPAATPSPSPSASPSAAPSPTPGRSRVRHAPGPAPARAATALSLLTAGSAVLTGLSFDGIAQVPTAAGPVPMLKFSMAAMTFSGGTRLLVTQGGQASLARGSSLGFSGNVVLYTTELSGDLNGARVTFTPKRPPSGLGRDVTLANVAAHQPYTTAGSLQASGLTDSQGDGEGGALAR